jgi:hypothetical protein
METAGLSFERDIKPLFRASDRESMRAAFDLWSYEDVKDHADDIARVLGDGVMPCDGAWPEAQVGIFNAWAGAGSPP